MYIRLPPRSNERGGVAFFLSVLLDLQQNASGLERLFMRFAVMGKSAAVQRIVNPAFDEQLLRVFNLVLYRTIRIDSMQE